MELGYNTDITLDNGTFHVQTEGRLDTNPRVDTLVYKNGVVLQRVSNPDGELGKDDLRIEETKRKIRDQHLAVVGLVRRNEFEKIGTVQPGRTAYGFLEGLPGSVSADWHDVLMGRHEIVFEEWKRAMADAAGLITPQERSQEFRDILAALAALLDDEAVPAAHKEGLVNYLLRLDSRFKAIDFYEAFRRERGDVAEYADLIAALKQHTDRLVDTLIVQSSADSALATELLIELFVRQSMELVKYLFEEAEKKLTGASSEGSQVLPTVLLYLEEKVSSENLSARELDDIFDRLSYLYARLSVKTVREISSRIGKIRDERGVRPRLRADQKKKVAEYTAYLDACKEVIEQTSDLEEKLGRINEFKAHIDGWDKVLRLYINLRLALKGYHNFVTVNILETAEVVCMKLKKVVHTLPQREYQEANLVLADLEGSLQANMNVRKIIVPAIKAQAILAQGGEAVSDDAVEALAEPEPEAPEEAGMEELSADDIEPVVLTEPLPTMPEEAPPKVSQVRAVEERIKVWALAMLKAMDELVRATEELSALEQTAGLPDAQRARLQTCRRELLAKKKILQQRLSSL